jgi:hypothetical protein
VKVCEVVALLIRCPSGFVFSQRQNKTDFVLLALLNESVAVSGCETVLENPRNETVETSLQSQRPSIFTLNPDPKITLFSGR